MKRITAILAFTLLVSAAPAFAITVIPGTSTQLNGITAAEDPNLNGTPQFASDISDAAHTGTADDIGWQTLTNVIREPTGLLDFTYRIVNTSDTAFMNWSFTVNNMLFPDADVRLDSPGTPLPITLSVSPQGIGTFSSTIPLGPGEGTQTIFIRGGVTDFKQDNGATLNVDFSLSGAENFSHDQNFLTLGAAPEPASLALLALAVGALAARLRRAH